VKKILPLSGLAALVLLQAAVAWNARLYWRARATAAPDAKIRLLRRAAAVFPWNEAVHFELGKLYFARGAEALESPAERDESFARSVASHLRSLRLNPASPAAHFELAQTLLYLSYLGRPTPVDSFGEYRRAAELTGHNSQIRYDVGKVLLGRWDILGPEEKEFAAGILAAALDGSGAERLPDLLETWSLSARDSALMDRILPEDPASLRTYAAFLGERALDPEARRMALARAEALDVAAARAELDRGRRAADEFRMAEAAEHAAAALKAMEPVRFYQALGGRKLFEPKDFEGLRKGARRLLAMSRIEETRSLSDPDGALAAYLAVEDDFTALGEFETFLKERGLLEGDEEASPFRDLRSLGFRLNLDFKLNRYRDIARIGGLLASSSLVIAPSGRSSYVRVLRLIGESNLKLDNVYEAERFYRKAIEAAPDDLDVLLGLERCYGRLNDEVRGAEVRAGIERLTSPAEIDLGGEVVPKGGTREAVLVTPGGPRRFRVDLAPSTALGGPLVAVFCNGRVAWEGIGDTGPIEFTAALPPGRTTIEIQALSGPVGLARIAQNAGNLR
jgi:tetratricopeptide (TPR) repeat protein